MNHRTAQAQRRLGQNAMIETDPQSSRSLHPVCSTSASKPTIIEADVRELMEDAADSALAHSRRNEPSIPMAKAFKSFKKKKRARR